MSRRPFSKFKRRRAPIVIGTAENGRRVFLTPEHRAVHIQVVGASGTGKTKWIENAIRQDIVIGDGLCVIDPHGTLYDDIVKWCATHRLLDRRPIRLFNPSAEDWCVGFNPLQLDGKTDITVHVDAMVNVCAQVWGGEDTARTPLLKRCLRAIFYVLAISDLTLVEAVELLIARDPDGVRRYLTSGISDRLFQSVWDEFNALAQSSQREFMAQFSSTVNRLMEFLSAPVIRTIVGQRDHVIDFRRCMDRGEIVLVNLAPSNMLSFDNARLLGTLIVNDLFLKAVGRPPGSRPFYLYIDECYQYLNADIENILDQARKFGLHLILAHQRLGQLRKAGPSVFNAVMTGAQTKVIFGGLEAEDAELLAKNVFLGEFNLEEVKHTFDKPVVIGHEPVWLQSESRSAGLSVSHGRTVTSGENRSNVLSASFDQDGVQVSHSTADGMGSSESTAATESGTYSTSRTEGKSQTLKPVLRTMPTQGYSLQEHIHRAVVALVNQGPREAIVKVPGARSQRIITPLVNEGFARHERIERFEHAAFAASEFARPRSVAEAEVTERYNRLRTDARAYLIPPEPLDFKEPMPVKKGDG